MNPADLLSTIGMSLDEFIESHRKFEANSRWCEEHSDEIKKKYGRQLIIVADETIYPVKHIKEFKSFLTQLEEQGVNVGTAVRRYIPEKGYIPPIRFPAPGNYY